MSGAFTGISDEQWNVLEKYIPEFMYIFGRPRPDRRELINTILFILITGSRWCDVPTGKVWGKRSTAHKYLGIWQKNGTLDRLRTFILEEAEAKKLINWQMGSIDGSFSPRKRRW